MNLTSDELIAVNHAESLHEAAHAVAAVRLGLPLKYTTLRAEIGAGGESLVTFDEEDPHAAAVVLLAGLAADHYSTGGLTLAELTAPDGPRPACASGTGDLGWARRFVGADAEKIEAAFHEACDFVARDRDALLRLARVMRERRGAELTETDVQAVMHATGGKSYVLAPPH